MCHEALKAFHDTIMINGRNAIEAERSNSYAWIDAGNSLLTSALPPNPVTLATLEWMNFENLKIAAGFELALKAKLLENDYIVQKIGRSDARYNTIAIAQEQTPIKKSDIFAIDGFRFDG